MGKVDAGQRFWSSQTSSRHRSSDSAFYSAKAAEHASLMSPEHRIADCVDLGCGAGELLEHLCAPVNVTAGLDYSDAMLENARERLGSSHPARLLNEDVFTYLPGSSHEVWLTTGALNQYLEPARLSALLDLFAGHRRAKAFYLFDSVDPLRFKLMPHGISYRPEHADVQLKTFRELYRGGRRILERIGLSVQLATGAGIQPAQKLPTTAMGYGYLPRFWLLEATRRGLSVEIVSSRFYEYRYHIVLQKEGGDVG